MKYINKEEIAKAIRDGRGINIEEILDEFKGILLCLPFLCKKDNTHYTNQRRWSACIRRISQRE